jgi:hypothetical protein
MPQPAATPEENLLSIAFRMQDGHQPDLFGSSHVKKAIRKTIQVNPSKLAKADGVMQRAFHHFIQMENKVLLELEGELRSEFSVSLVSR